MIRNRSQASNIVVIDALSSKEDLIYIIEFQCCMNPYAGFSFFGLRFLVQRTILCRGYAYLLPECIDKMTL